MMQAVRSATNQRRQEGQWGAGDDAEPGRASPSLADFAAHGASEAGSFGDAAGPKALVRQPSRFRETIMQAEELSIRRLRAVEKAKGGLLLRVFGIGRSFGGLPGSKLIHPNSPFASFVLCCSALLLLYSALASAFLVGFLWLSGACDEPPPTIYFDLFVDSFFILEITMNFFTGAYLNGEYTDNMTQVARKYVSGGFVFDIATSIPVSFVEISIVRQCQEMSMNGLSMESMGADSNILRIIRTSKALRVARLLRAFKIVARLKSIMGFVSFVGDYLRIPPYVLRISKIGMLLTMLVHICTCAYWLIKSTSNDEEVFHEFLDIEMLSHDPKEDLTSKYILAFYFVNTVFCTIGFGDVAGTNNAERMFCVLLFYLGVFVFGSLLVEVQDAIQKAGLDRRDREQELNNMVSFLRAEDVPRQLERHMVQWADFGMREQQRYHSRNKVLGMVPSHLHRELMHALHQGLLTSVPLFMHIDSIYKEDLLLDLWETMRPKVFSAFVPIAAAGNKKAELFVITAGTVILQRGKNVLSTLKKGDSFGANFEKVVAMYDASVSQYFELCRSRIMADKYNEDDELALADSDMDAESDDNNPQGNCAAARAGSNANRRNASSPHEIHSPCSRTPSLPSQVSRARWIHLVKRAYARLFLPDHALGREDVHTQARMHLWRRAASRYRAISHPADPSPHGSFVKRTPSSGSPALNFESQPALTDSRFRFGSGDTPRSDQSAPKDQERSQRQQSASQEHAIDAGFTVEIHAKLIDLMAAMCHRMESLELQQLNLHRSLLPACVAPGTHSHVDTALGKEQCDADGSRLQDVAPLEAPAKIEISGEDLPIGAAATSMSGENSSDTRNVAGGVENLGLSFSQSAQA